MCFQRSLIMSCHRPIHVLFNRIGITAVSPRLFCAQICKQTAKPGRFYSNVSSVDEKQSDSQSGGKKIEKKLSKTEKMQGSDSRRSGKKKTKSIRIFDEKAANIIVTAVKTVFDENKVVFEFNAGSGLLSKQLIKGGMKNVMALEPRKSFGTLLENLEKSQKKSFNYFIKSIHDVLLYSDEEFSTNIPGVEKSKKGCDVQIIGQASSWHLLIEISRQMRNRQSFLSGKSLNLCLCLPQESWENFLDSKLQRMCVVERILFQVSFEYKILTSIAKRYFYFTLSKRDQMKLNPNDKMVLIHVKSKPDQDFDLTELQIFLTQFHNCSSRNRLIIPSLEQWSPSCGEELVKRGMAVFTRFSDLQPEELLKVFRYFKSLPNVEASDFLCKWKNDFQS